MNATLDLAQLDVQQLRELVVSMHETVVSRDREIAFKQALIDKMTHEMAVLKWLKFAARSEHFSPEQRSLLAETIDTDIAALELELALAKAKAKPAKPPEKAQPKRQPLPADLPRTEHHYEPANVTCSCGCGLIRIGEDVAEKLDYVPSVSTVERHIRDKWVCSDCETVVQAPVAPHIIDKGIPTTGLLAQVLVAKFADHLPLYRQEAIFGRAGLGLPRSTLGAWVGSCGVQLQPLVDALKAEILTHSVVHADETPVQMLKPGNGKTHRAYLWAYAAGAFEETRAVVYDFCESRAGQNAKVFLGDWRGSLVCDDFSGYKQLMNQGVTEVGCLAHARRKFFDLHASNKSQIAHSALVQIGRIYGIEREVKDIHPDERRRIRQDRSKPLLDALHQWMVLNRQQITDGSATAKALGCAHSLRIRRAIAGGQQPY